MTFAVRSLKTRKDILVRRQSTDARELQTLREHYAPFLSWTDRGILHDLKRKHGRSDPSLKLLHEVAMIVAQTYKLTVGRQEKRRKEFAIGWLNEHYEYVEPMLDDILMRDTTGGPSGRVDLAQAYLTNHRGETDQKILFQSDLDE
jgi:hypothetical protein